MTTSDLHSERITGGSSRLRPRNWSLAVKLLVTLLVPTLLALGLGGLRILDQIHAANALGQSDKYATVQDAASKLTGELARERDRAAVLVATSRNADVASVQAAFGATDAAWREVRGQVGDQSALPTAVAAAYRGAEAGVARLVALRAGLAARPPAGSPVPPLAGSPVPPPLPSGPVPALPGQPAGVQSSAAGEVVKQYTAIIQPVLLLRSVLSRQLQAPGIVELESAFEAVGAIRDEIAQQHALIAAAIVAGGRLPAGDMDAVRATDARLSASADEFASVLTPDRRDRLGGFLTGANYRQFELLKQGAIRQATANQPVATAPADWDGVYDRLVGDLGAAESGIRSEIEAISTAQINDANNLAGTSGAVLLLAILLATTIMVMVVRAMLRSLRTLRSSALDVAERRLPQAVQSMRSGQVPDITVEPVPVTTREEIGQVARAFDAVHGQAVRLAAEQATLQANVSSMFVNLSRRSQGLVERQLELIEQLESNEEDPEQLSNLFQLDHLATRMRRNSENLLVLAGGDLTRRGGQSVPLVDVLRAAVSEVEQYQRIVVQPPPLAKVLGRAASDLVHLLAELLDNATIYSAPSTQVVMSSRRLDDGSVLIEIDDRGVGMSAEDLADANERINGTPSVNVSTSRRMGLFVVGRLAARHGIGVHLASGGAVNTGVTASVSAPSNLVSRNETRPLDATGPLDRSDVRPLPASPQHAGPVTGPVSGPVNGLGRVRELPGAFYSWDLSGSTTNGAFGPAGSDGAESGAAGWRGPGSPLGGRPGPGPSGGARVGGAPAGPGAPRAERVAGALFGGPADEPEGLHAAADPEAAPDTADRPPKHRGAVDDIARKHTITAEGPAVEPKPIGAPAPAAPDERASDEQAPDEQASDEAAAGSEHDDSENGAQPTPPEQVPATDDEQASTPAVNAAASDATVLGDGLDEARAAETTPIFASIASAWFSAQRPVPVEWRAEDGDAPEASTPAPPEIVAVQPTVELPAQPAVPELESTEAAAEPDTPVPAGQPQPVEPAVVRPAAAADPAPERSKGAPAKQPSPLPRRVPARPGAPAPTARAASAAPTPPEPTPPAGPGNDPAPPAAPTAHGRTSGVSIPSLPKITPPQPQWPAQPHSPAAFGPRSSEFASPADLGWEAAQSLADPEADDGPEELTEAGLPRRQPRARLIPGSAGPGGGAARSSRSAEQVRGRLASYQAGIREGRAERARRPQHNAAAATGGRQPETRDEEQR